MVNNQFISDKFGFLVEDFFCRIWKACNFYWDKSKNRNRKRRSKNKFVPFLIKGSIRFFSLNDGRELIYYYVRPNESYLKTFSSIFSDLICRIYAVAEEDSEVILIPVSVVHEWLIRFPQNNRIFYSEYEKRFVDVMHMVNDAVFHKLDKRVVNYIKQQISINGQNAIKLTHKEIANNLGTSREIVSRVLKKNENEGEISQTKEGIKMLVL